MDPDASTECSCKLSTKIVTSTEGGGGEDSDEVIFELQFLEKCRWVSCSSDGEQAVVVRESEFPVEEKVFVESQRRMAKAETSKEAIRRMVYHMCVPPMSREYFVRDISSYAQEVVAKEIRGETRRLAIVVEMVTLTTLPANGVENSTPDVDFAIDDVFGSSCCFW